MRSRSIAKFAPVPILPASNGKSRDSLVPPIEVVHVRIDARRPPHALVEPSLGWRVELGRGHQTGHATGHRIAPEPPSDPLQPRRVDQDIVVRERDVRVGGLREPSVACP